jgi:hypothetical protein
MEVEDFTNFNEMYFNVLTKIFGAGINGSRYASDYTL